MSFPEVRDIGLFFEHPEVAAPAGTIVLSLLIQAGEDGRLADNFRLTLTAVRNHRVSFSGSACYEHARFHNFVFRCEFQPSDLVFLQNRFTSKWMDLADLVSAGSVLVLADEDHSDDQEDSDGFLQLLEKHKDDAHPPACAIRWMIVMDDVCNFNLMLQSLPATAARSESGIYDTCGKISISKEKKR